MDEFDEVLLLDDTFVDRGFEEGKQAGSEKAKAEGVELGRGKGAEVGIRIAAYHGRIDAFRALQHAHPSVFPKRADAALEQATRSLVSAERGVRDPRNQAGFDALEDVETRMRIMDSLLKLLASKSRDDGQQTLDF
mmetsp:Transcript_21446/g.57659  ORF Transcript_21446/g.57659 Transcript_21446/m.57659 type:complete len:136 (+) Transcript_21446:13-420(+)